MRKIFCLLVLVGVMSSCGEYNKILKSTDTEQKYEYAKAAFEKKKYTQAYTILEDLVAIFKGTPRAEESLYLLARSHYLNKDYLTSGEYFQAYYRNFPPDLVGTPTNHTSQRTGNRVPARPESGSVQT